MAAKHVSLQEDGRPPKSFSLATGVSETLKVNPARRLLNIMMTGKHGAAKKVGNVINIHFEGNWMPIQVCLISLALHMQLYQQAGGMLWQL